MFKSGRMIPNLLFQSLEKSRMLNYFPLYSDLLVENSKVGCFALQFKNYKDL